MGFYGKISLKVLFFGIIGAIYGNSGYWLMKRQVFMLEKGF